MVNFVGLVKWPFIVNDLRLELDGHHMPVLRRNTKLIQIAGRQRLTV
jgi:hypothetical protein